MSGKKLLLIFAGLFLFLNLFNVMAYNSGFGPFGSYGGFGGSPLYVLMNDEWAQVAIIFVIFFGVIFFATKKLFKNEAGIAAVVSVAIALIISMSLYRKGFLFDYLGGDIGALAVFFALLLAIAFLIRLIYVNLGRGMTALLLIFLYPIMIFIDLTSWLPDGRLLYYAQNFQYFLASFVGILVYLAIIIIILAQSDPMSKFFGRIFRRNG